MSLLTQTLGRIDPRVGSGALNANAHDGEEYVRYAAAGARDPELHA